MKETRRIAIALEIDVPHPHHQDVYAGILHYAEEHPDWVCYIDEHPDAGQDSKFQGEHRYDGVIGRATLPMQRGLKRLGIPLVKPLLPRGLLSWAAVASSMVTPLSADDGK